MTDRWRPAGGFLPPYYAKMAIFFLKNSDLAGEASQGTALDEDMTMIPDWHLPVAAVLNHFELAGCTQNHCQIGNRAWP